jgi:hypothetical protein
MSAANAGTAQSAAAAMPATRNFFIQSPAINISRRLEACPNHLPQSNL